MGKTQKSRRELIEKMQRDQARSDKRRTWIIVGVSIIVGLGIIAFPAVKLIQDSKTRNQAIPDIGVKASAASCDAIIDDPASGLQDHKPDGTKITYSVSPPSSGPHYQNWAPFGKTFYADSDRPAIENLVHNLEHGYTILWYNEAVAKDSKKLEVIERIAKAKLPDSARGKFIAAPFKSTDGAAWPAGKNIAFSHWSGGDAKTAKGHRQFCAEPSGEALAQFMDKYPATDAQEPNGG
ncbi:DUF3105 domain-containing protein [Kribbella deserti]|uniref:DUF3105 domain-containing protein n=1 Tax=Kribbella deserti TaxID=1926257 RepID=A0ABV6QSG7_9ACTN